MRQLNALTEEQMKGRRTLEAGLQSVEARILEAIASSRGDPVEPVCTPPRVCKSQDRMRPHPTPRPDGLLQLWRVTLPNQHDFGGIYL